MKRRITLAVAIMAFNATASLAQTHQPYAGFETRAIKALSDEQIADLRAGRGMGLALAAELNGYPGPSHVMEHADALKLTPDQRARVERLFAQMKSEAVAIGERLIAEEVRLDRQFATHAATATTLSAATRAIGEIQGDLRATHLRYHLLTTDVLTPDQLRRYAELRGYSSRHGAPHDPTLHNH